MAPEPGQRGVALLVVLGALTSLAVLVALLFTLAHQEQRQGHAALGLEQARAVAEGGAALTLTTWPGAGLAALMPGDSVTLPGAALAPAGWFQGRVRRLGPGSFLILSTGTSRDSSARIEVGLLAQLDPPPPPPAALSARRVLGPPIRVSGQDWPVQSLGCEGGDNAAAVAGPLPDLATTLPALARRADLALPHGFDGPIPPPPVPWPTILAQGDLKLTGGLARGTLLVTGTLMVEGGAVFQGVVLASGSLGFGPGAGRLVGLVAADSVDLASARAAGPAIQYSSCYFTIAWSYATTLRPAGERAWFHAH